MSAVRRVSLNIDLGELPDEPVELFGLATVANIACGGHAGDASSMRRALERCAQLGTRVAAHPSYVDRANFGRVSVAISTSDLRQALSGQLRALAELAAEAAVTIASVKPHGALYHDAARDPLIARVVADVVPAGTVVVGPPTGALRDACVSAGREFAAEGFADRSYRPDGTLIPRNEPNAVITEPADAARQAVALAASGRFHTLCVHGDNPRALDVARAVRTALDRANLLEHP